MEKSTEQALREQNASIKREEIYRGKTICLRRDTYQLGEEMRHWDIVEHPGAVVLVPVSKNKQLLLVKQWRRAIGKIILEFPAGTLEKEEKLLVCAQRELQEETGYKAGKIISLGGFFSAPGFCTEYLHLFLAFDLEKAPLSADEDEAIDLVMAPFEQIEEMIENHHIQDAKTIAGFYRYARWLKTQKI